MIRQTSSKDRDGEAASVVKHPLSGGDRSRDHKSGSMKRKKAQNLSLDSSHHVESNRADEFPSSSISSARERRVRNDLRAPSFAPDRDRDRDSDGTVACSEVRRTPADSYGQAASINVVRLGVQSKFPSCVPGIEQLIHAPSGSRARDRDSAPPARADERPAYK